jgi:hypothetical protein
VGKKKRAVSAVHSLQEADEGFRYQRAQLLSGHEILAGQRLEGSAEMEREEAIGAY